MALRLGRWWWVPIAVLAAFAGISQAHADHGYAPWPGYPNQENHWGHGYQPKVDAPAGSWMWAYTGEAEWVWTNSGFNGFCVGACATGVDGCGGQFQGGVLKVCTVGPNDAPLYGYRYGYTQREYRTTNFVTGESHIHAVRISACLGCNLSDGLYHSLINHEYGHALMGNKHSYVAGSLMRDGQNEGNYTRYPNWHDVAELQWVYNHAETN